MRVTNAMAVSTEPYVGTWMVARGVTIRSLGIVISESAYFLSPVKTWSTYGPTIVAIAQWSFAWRQIWRRD